MFKHNNKAEAQTGAEKTEAPQAAQHESSATPLSSDTAFAPKVDSAHELRELLEKNLKWSQIIYEQNRKINNKLMWSAIGSWVRVFILLVPFILAFWFIPPFVRNLQEKYDIFTSKIGGAPTNATVMDLIKLFPVGVKEQEQIKTLLK